MREHLNPCSFNAVAFNEGLVDSLPNQNFVLRACDVHRSSCAPSILQSWIRPYFSIALE